MATTTFTTAPTNVTDTTFRDWGSQISTALSAIGLVKTADTGQIDWATVLTPSAATQSRGYEIYRFNDSLQATYPIFIKVEYGSASGASIPAIWYTVGATTDGAGTLSNLLAVRAQLSMSSSTATTYKSYASMLANGSGMALVIWAGGGTNYSRHVIVERSCDSSGVPNGNGTATTSKLGGATSFSFIAANYATKTLYSTATTAVTIPTYSMLSGGVAPLHPMLAVIPGYEWNLRSGVVGHTTDLGAADTLLTVPGVGYGTYINTGLYYMDTNTSNMNAVLAIAWPP